MGSPIDSISTNSLRIFTGEQEAPLDPTLREDLFWA